MSPCVMTGCGNVTLGVLCLNHVKALSPGQQGVYFRALHGETWTIQRMAFGSRARRTRKVHSVTLRKKAHWDDFCAMVRAWERAEAERQAQREWDRKLYEMDHQLSMDGTCSCGRPHEREQRLMENVELDGSRAPRRMWR